MCVRLMQVVRLPFCLALVFPLNPLSFPPCNLKYFQSGRSHTQLEFMLPYAGSFGLSANVCAGGSRFQESPRCKYVEVEYPKESFQCAMKNRSRRFIWYFVAIHVRA
ncbi:hypothetical protein GGR57DRAFT_467056 [Xylariaceae sp. FL1272]|nr:hypothetical protein GGR57DRAFT_467056 [Xylariaceae sp. FL1272]